jgi:hypothetical protein
VTQSFPAFRYKRPRGEGTKGNLVPSLSLEDESRPMPSSGNCLNIHINTASPLSDPHDGCGGKCPQQLVGKVSLGDLLDYKPIRTFSVFFALSWMSWQKLSSSDILENLWYFFPPDFHGNCINLISGRFPRSRRRPTAKKPLQCQIDEGPIVIITRLAPSKGEFPRVPHACLTSAKLPAFSHSVTVSSGR